MSWPYSKRYGLASETNFPITKPSMWNCVFSIHSLIKTALIIDRGVLILTQFHLVDSYCVKRNCIQYDCVRSVVTPHIIINLLLCNISFDESGDLLKVFHQISTFNKF